ncbi:MAG: hypothetical protein BWY19_00703 [bacterium ADurb.Bin212]|nr:MAG: hypothetical protein BWY19_00703 [bacterium ADurb.Bin212]
MELIRKNMRKIISTLLLIWSTVFFCLMSPVVAVNIAIITVSVVLFLLIIFNKDSVISILYLNFISGYVLYGYILLGNAPVWLVMIGMLIINIYLTSGLLNYNNIDQNLKRIYLVVYALLIVEIFLFLGYFILSPANRSLILTLCLYLIYGYNDEVIKKDIYDGFYRYVVVFFLIFVTIVMSASWGNI